jgi:hypothetical protein
VLHADSINKICITDYRFCNIHFLRISTNPELMQIFSNVLCMLNVSVFMHKKVFIFYKDLLYHFFKKTLHSGVLNCFTDKPKVHKMPLVFVDFFRKDESLLIAY